MLLAIVTTFRLHSHMILSSNSTRFITYPTLNPKHFQSGLQINTKHHQPICHHLHRRQCKFYVFFCDCTHLEIRFSHDSSQFNTSHPLFHLDQLFSDQSQHSSFSLILCLCYVSQVSRLSLLCELGDSSLTLILHQQLPPKSLFFLSVLRTN